MNRDNVEGTAKKKVVKEMQLLQWELNFNRRECNNFWFCLLWLHRGERKQCCVTHRASQTIYTKQKTPLFRQNGENKKLIVHLNWAWEPIKKGEEKKMSIRTLHAYSCTDTRTHTAYVYRIRTKTKITQYRRLMRLIHIFILHNDRFNGNIYNILVQYIGTHYTWRKKN